ncbi:hypothetical protein OAH12_00210 [Cyclobacteriaceae bacterium]|nr:hypothetical protein [Cyclobacteriaceae bacterium]
MKINENAFKFIFDETLFKPSQVAEDFKPETDIQFIGKNNRKTLIFVSSTNPKEVISEQSLTFLSKILISVGLTLDDVVVTNHSKDKKLKEYTDTFSPKTIISFGIETFELGIQNIEIPSYEIKDYNGISVLYTDALDKVKEDISKKKALWINLKQLFN